MLSLVIWSSSGLITPLPAYSWKLGPFIQNTSGAAPPLTEALSLVQYWSQGVSSTLTVMFGWLAVKVDASSCMIGTWFLSHTAYERVTLALGSSLGLSELQAARPAERAATVRADSPSRRNFDI